MLDVDQIVMMQVECVDRWHQLAPDADEKTQFAAYDHGVLGIAIRQHRFNYDLWHQEDIARSPDVSEGQIAQVKRAIDRLNQARNDWIEKLDDWITNELEKRDIRSVDGKLNTETPGSAIDRLSIVAIRIYHLHEQLERTDVDASHLDKVRMRIQICSLQQKDLAQSLKELLDDIAAGKKRHRTYRQYKMYNDPTLNPYLYKSGAKGPAT